MCHTFTYGSYKRLNKTIHTCKDFFNGWDTDVLQKALNECNCNPYGDPSCCVSKGLFDLDQSKRCFLSTTVNETSKCNSSFQFGPK